MVFLCRRRVALTAIIEDVASTVKSSAVVKGISTKGEQMIIIMDGKEVYQKCVGHCGWTLHKTGSYPQVHPVTEIIQWFKAYACSVCYAFTATGQRAEARDG